MTSPRKPGACRTLAAEAPRAALASARSTAARHSRESPGCCYEDTPRLPSIDASFLDQFVPGLAATLVGGTILLVGGTYGIDRWLQRKQRRARLHIVRRELGDAREKVDRFTSMLKDEDAAPYARFGVRGWDLLSEGRVLEALDHRVAEALRKAYEEILQMNAKLDRFADLKLGTPVVVMRTSMAAAMTGSPGAIPPVMEDMDRRYDELVSEVKENMLERLPGLRNDIDSAIAAMPS